MKNVWWFKTVMVMRKHCSLTEFHSTGMIVDLYRAKWTGQSKEPRETSDSCKLSFRSWSFRFSSLFPPSLKSTYLGNAGRQYHWALLYIWTVLIGTDWHMLCCQWCQVSRFHPGCLPFTWKIHLVANGANGTQKCRLEHPVRSTRFPFPVRSEKTGNIS